MKEQTIQAAIDAVDNEYFHSMRTVSDRIDRDEQIDRLEIVKQRVKRYDSSRAKAIAERRREMNR